MRTVYKYPININVGRYAIAAILHPDRGGSTEAMANVNRAYADARKELWL